MSGYERGPVRSELARAIARATRLLGDMETRLGDLPYDRVKPMFDEINAVRHHLSREAKSWADAGTGIPYYVTESESETETV